MITAGAFVVLGAVAGISGGDSTTQGESVTSSGVDGTITAADSAASTSPATAVPMPTPTTAARPTPTPATTPAVPAEYRNALREAESYLDYSAFSRSGLIDQLEYEQYSTEAAAWAVDNVSVDWNEQAALSAASYLEYSSFSEGGLRDQLAYENFSAEQIDYAISQMKSLGRL